MEWLGKQVLGMPRPDKEMMKEQSNQVGKIQGKYEIYDKANKHF